MGIPTYTREMLVGPVAEAAHMADLLRTLGVENTNGKRRAMMTAGVEERCLTCGCDGTWQGNPLRLMIDHINGDWLDNRLENLRYLCPNCHAQTATWCRKKSRRTA